MLSRFGIPTVYEGVRFRSRLEARWAAFFDLVGWEWEYEPFDLEGYIPDFLLPFTQAPMLVEIKPDFTHKSLTTSIEKMDATSWGGEALLLGSRFITDRVGFAPTLGVSPGLFRERSSSGWNWQPAVFGVCSGCHRLTVVPTYGVWRCRRCGHLDGDHTVEAWCERPKWAEAQNAVQWRPYL